MPESDPRLAEIVRGHLHIHAVADADADEVLPHLAGDVGEDFVPIGQSDTKHRPRQHLGDRSVQLNWFFFWQTILLSDKRLSIRRSPTSGLTDENNSILWRRTMPSQHAKIKQLLCELEAESALKPIDDYEA
jgi:hypothetical protein